MIPGPCFKHVLNHIGISGGFKLKCCFTLPSHLKRVLPVNQKIVGTAEIYFVRLRNLFLFVNQCQIFSERELMQSVFNCPPAQIRLALINLKYRRR